MVRITGIDWERTNHSHATKHGMTREDIEDIIFSSDYAPLVERAKADRYAVHGRNSTGEYGTAFVQCTDDDEFIVLCARPSTEAEKKRYKDLRNGKRGENSTAV